jgi:hypothetical protein
MVHSVELVFDSDTEAVIRNIWDQLRGLGIPSQAPASRPHVTLTVAERIDPEVDAVLAALADRLPVPCVVGAPLLFGRSTSILTRLIIPTVDLLAIHTDVYRLTLPHTEPGPMANSAPGQWTGHTTLARRVQGSQLGRALRVGGRPSEIKGRFIGLRRWDGNAKREYPIG